MGMPMRIIAPEHIDPGSVVPFVSATMADPFIELRGELTYYDEPDGTPVLTLAPGKYHIEGSSAYLYG
jgi:hypothetical protein